jgi:Icc-related predicted phosphoesterase
MEIFYASDLHIEFEDNHKNLNFKNLDADLAILAGDIGVGTAGIEWAADAFEVPVIYVMGNHEFYHHDFHQLRSAIREAAQALGVHVLDGDSIDIEGVRFAGCTLWTDYQANGEPESAMRIAEQVMPDHSCVTCGAPDLWSPEHAQAEHERALAWLASLEDVDVVITHHCPSLSALGHRHPQNEYTPLFASALDALIAQVDAKAWIFGHHHCSIDIAHPSGTRLLSNQHGYPNEDQVDIGWDPNVILSL